jgi:hypothetical protein
VGVVRPGQGIAVVDPYILVVAPSQFLQRLHKCREAFAQFWTGT